MGILGCRKGKFEFSVVELIFVFKFFNLYVRIWDKLYFIDGVGNVYFGFLNVVIFFKFLRVFLLKLFVCLSKSIFLDREEEFFD